MGVFLLPRKKVKVLVTIDITQLEDSCDRIINLLDQVVDYTQTMASNFDDASRHIQDFSSIMNNSMDTTKVSGFFDTFIKYFQEFSTFLSPISNVANAFEKLGIDDKIGGMLENASNSLDNFKNTFSKNSKGIENIVKTAISGITTAVSFLAENPMIAIVAAVGLAIGAFAAFAVSQQETTYELEDCSASVQKQMEDINNLSGALDKAKASAESRTIASEAEIQALENNVALLKEMENEDHFVDNLDAAQVLVDKINAKIPETVKLTEDGRLEWLKMPDAIQGSIEALKEKARVEASMQLYTEAIKAQITAEREHGKAVDQLSEKKERQIYLDNKRKELQDFLDSNRLYLNPSELKDYEQQIADIDEELEKIPADLQFLQEGVDKSDQAWSEATDTVNEYGDAMSNNQGKIVDTTGVLKKATKEQQQELQKLGESYTSTQKTLEDYANKSVEMDEKQVVSAIMNKNQTIDTYAEKAKQMGISYDEMISILMEQGIALGEEEKAQLERSINASGDAEQQKLAQFQTAKERTLEVLRVHNEDMTLEDELKYNSLFEDLQNYGIAVDAENAEQYARMLEIAEENNVNVKSVQGEQFIAMLGLLEQYGVDMDAMNSEQYAKIIELANQNNIDMSTLEGQQYLGLLGLLEQYGLDLDTIQSGQYARMLELANQNNIDLSTVQGQQYAQFLVALEENGIAIDSELGQQYAEQFFKASSAGEAEGTAYINQMKTGFASKNLIPETDKVIKETGAQIKGNPQEIGVNVENPSDDARKVRGDIKEIFAEAVFGTVSFMAKFNMENLPRSLASFLVSIIPEFFAEGGFPSVGQMFIAREAGPELVGTIGGRTAVANNKQILNGIYYAVKDALAYPQQGGDLYLTIQNEDGSKIEKIIRNYNRFMSRTGGKGGFVV